MYKNKILKSDHICVHIGEYTEDYEEVIFTLHKPTIGTYTLKGKEIISYPDGSVRTYKEGELMHVSIVKKFIDFPEYSKSRIYNNLKRLIFTANNFDGLNWSNIKLDNYTFVNNKLSVIFLYNGEIIINNTKITGTKFINLSNKDYDIKVSSGLAFLLTYNGD